MKNKLTKDDFDCSFSIFHNNISSLNRNLENLQTHVLDELNFHFDIIGVTETKLPIQILLAALQYQATNLNTFPHL